MWCESCSWLHSKQAALPYAELMALLVMLTLHSSVISLPSVPICLLPVKQKNKKRLNGRRANLNCNKKTPPLLWTHLKKEFFYSLPAETYVSWPSSSPPIHHHLLLACCRRSPPMSLSLIQPVPYPIIHALYICGLCSMPHPSSTLNVITLCIKHLVSACQALATGAASQLHCTLSLKRHRAHCSQRHGITSGINPLAPVFIWKICGQPLSCSVSVSLAVHGRLSKWLSIFFF